MFAIVFQYRVAEGAEKEFERVYGPAGDWVAFFRQGDGYLGTDLYRDLADARTFLLVDRWTTPAAYNAFATRYADEYERRERATAAQYERETRVGAFLLVGEAS